MSDLAYLYGFVPADASPPAGLSGIDRRPVMLLDAGAVKVVISHVPSHAYAAEQVEARLQDLAWVAEQGIAHETVVAWFVDHSDILPVSLFTLFSSDDALRKDVAPRASQLAAELGRLKNKREWDVKISFDELEAERHAAELSPRVAALEAEAAEAAPGRRYLLDRKRSDLVKTETRHGAQNMAGEVIAATRGFADEVLTLPIPNTPDELPVILHAALLVDRDAEVDLVTLLERQSTRLRGRGLTLAFSGPWAPYRFTGAHERASAGA